MNILLLAFADVLSMWKIALPAMFLGCYCGVVLRSGRFFTLFSKAVRPLVSLGKLPEALGPFFILCLLNRYAANAMLAELEKNGMLTKRTLISAYLMGSLPTGIYFTIFYFSPPLIAGFGWKLGMTFIAINIGMSTLITIAGLLWNRLPGFSREDSRYLATASQPAVTADPTDWLLAGKKALRQFYDIAVVFVPITFAFALLLHTDLTKELIAGLDPMLRWFHLTSAGVLVVIAGIPTILAAIGVAETLLRNGALPANDVIFVLLLTSFFHNVYDGLSRVLPANLSVFGVRGGFAVTATGTGLYLIIVALSAAITLVVKIIPETTALDY